MNVTLRNVYDTYQDLFSCKHKVFARFLSKCIIINSPESIFARLYSTKRDTKHKNHYDALEITPYATQNEIKSAYYKLSLQYHPDKNKSDYAKQKFQDISDAYEVLSNHEQRKNYDRHMMIRQQPVINIKESQHRNKVHTGATKIYNFDAWIQAHYGKEFEMSRIRRSNYQQHKKIDDIFTDATKNSVEPYILSFITIIIIIVFGYQRSQDVVVYKKETHIEKKEANTT